MTSGTRVRGARDGVTRVREDAVGKGPAVVKWASCPVCVGSSERGRVTAECAERNGTGAGWPVGWRFSGWSVALIR